VALASFVAATASLAVAADPPAGRATVVRHVLPNGTTLLVRESSGAAVVAASLVVRVGSREETAETAGITNFLHRVMIRGTSRHTGRQLAEAAEDMGGNLDASGEVEYAEVRGTALARHAETLLELMAEVALTATLPAEEVERERRLILSRIQTRADTPFPLAFDTLLADLYGRHPFGRPAIGRRESIARISREDLLARYRASYRGNQLVLAVSGQVTAERVRKVVERLFGPVPGAGPPTEVAAIEPAPSGQRRVVERQAQQAQILVGFLGPGVGASDYAATRVLGALLGGGMSGRLFVELRDNEGLAYSLGVTSPTRSRHTFLVAYLGTARENVAAAEAGLLRELERAKSGGIGEAELARAKAYVLGSLAMDRRTNARHAWYLAFFEAIGAGWDFPERYARTVEAVTAAEVQAAAVKYLTRPTRVVLMPR
jgi:predicted Zn-dependent peptidase